MDGQVGGIRRARRRPGRRRAILAYAAKYASALYGPFRDAVDVRIAGGGDRKGYQQDWRNGREALAEVHADLEQGADIVMVKPALAYLDVIAAVRAERHVPVAAYHVSGEYSMIKAAAANGWIDGDGVALEHLTAIKRAGADIILTYLARRARRDARLSARRADRRQRGHPVLRPGALPRRGLRSRPLRRAGLANNDELFERSCAAIPGGVSSPVRAFHSVGGTPYFVARAEGPYVWDAEGRRFIDLVQSYGAIILGHAHPAVVEAVAAAAADGTSYGAPTAREMKLAEAIRERVPSCDLVRLVNSGTEATMTALRLARGFTGRPKVLKFAGNYHGHGDALLAAGGSGVATLGLSGSAGVTDAAVSQTIVAPYNVVPELDHDVACVDRRAGRRQHGPGRAGRRLPGRAP